MDPSDLASEIENIRRDSLVSHGGVAYPDFRRTLTPRYGLLWAQILAAWVMLPLLGAALLAAEAAFGGWAWGLAPFGALGFGYLVAFIHLFLHEGAHYNLAAERSRSDWLTNCFVGLLVGQDVQLYRRVHFEHHRKLGTPDDTERSYFDPLDARFLLEGLTGIKVLRVMLNRERVGADALRSGARWQLLRALLLHLAIAATLLAVGSWLLAVSWFVGVAMVFPLLGALRQTLEHRSSSADPNVDYAQVAHGAVNRLFGDGPLASTFGGAGFNRHLLHHWEPQVSCTRLRELEAYLLETDHADMIQRHQTGYGTTLRGLLSRPKRG